jgi:hypothetical protein
MSNELPQKGDPLFFFDVETVACPKDDPLWVRLRDRMEKPPEKSDGDWDAHLEKLHSRTTLNGALGITWMIGFGVGNGDPVILEGPGTFEGEKKLLQEFEDHLLTYTNPWLVGHNILGFDIPFLQARALRHNLPKLARALGRTSMKPWERRVIDTQKVFPRTSNDRMAWQDGLYGLAKLETICEVLGIELQTGVMGKDVNAAFLSGDTDGAREHLVQDIHQLRQVFLRLWPIM